MNYVEPFVVFVRSLNMLVSYLQNDISGVLEDVYMVFTKYNWIHLMFRGFDLCDYILSEL